MAMTPGPEQAELGPLIRHEDGGLLLPGAEEPTVGVGPYQLAWRRLRRNRTALFFGAVFLLIVVVCLLAPVYADDIAHTGPNANHLSETIMLHGKVTNVVSFTGIPIGPTWHSKFFFGADPNGRDVAVRLLYGGRTSLLIGFVAAIVTIVIATIAGVCAGFFRGWVDAIISRILDIIWAYPVLLLAIAFGVLFALGAIDLGPLHNGSLFVPALIIGREHRQPGPTDSLPCPARGGRGSRPTVRRLAPAPRGANRACAEARWRAGRAAMATPGPATSARTARARS
jgi:hypothetical protein